MQGADIAEVDFSSLDASDFIPGGQSARKPVVFELTDCDSALSNGVQVIFTGTEATGMRGILAIDSYSGASGIGIGIETLSGVPVGMNDKEGAIFTLVTGNNALNLNAWVQRLPGEDLVPGTFFASALVTLSIMMKIIRTYFAADCRLWWFGIGQTHAESDVWEHHAILWYWP